MKLKIPTYYYFIGYFFLLLLLFHYKIKSYFYWAYIENLQDLEFGFSVGRTIVSVTLFFINLYVLFGIKKTKLSFIVVALFFTLLTIPSMIAFTSGVIYPVQLLLFHQGLFFALFWFSKVKINFDRVPVLNKKQALYLLLLITTMGLIPYLIVYGPHINLKNLVLLDVYKTRHAMGDLSNSYFGYTYSLFTKIILPLIIVFALELNKKIWVLLGVLYLVLFYLFGAHKTVYVGVLLVFVLYRLTFMQSVKYIVKYSTIFLGICILLAMMGFDYPWILTFRRIHFIPTLLDICYLDFFADRPLYWSESILKGFIEYPYDLKHTNLIGELYFKRPDVAANNGLVSDGYMNLNSLGVFFNIFLVAIYFMILNSLHIPSRYFGLYVLIIFSFISSSTLTVFLTHGAGILLIISLFLINEKPT